MLVTYTYTSWFTSRRHVCNGMWSGSMNEEGEQDEEEREWATCLRSWLFFASLSISLLRISGIICSPPSHYSLSSMLLWDAHIHPHKYAYTYAPLYMYTFRINSSVVSVITSRRIMFYNPTTIPICVILVSLSLRMMPFDLQGCNSQCAWLTKKKNVKDKICLLRSV